MLASALSGPTSKLQALRGGQPQLQIKGEQLEEEALTQHVPLIQWLEQARPFPADKGRVIQWGLSECNVDFIVPEVTYTAEQIRLQTSCNHLLLL